MYLLMFLWARPFADPLGVYLVTPQSSDTRIYHSPRLVSSEHAGEVSRIFFSSIHPHVFAAALWN